MKNHGFYLIEKIIAGFVCFVLAVICGWFSLMAYGWKNIIAISIPALMAAALIYIGCFLLVKRKAPLSYKAKIIIPAVFSIIFVFPFVLDAKIRFDRKVLQAQAKEFLSRPVPEMFKTNSVTWYGAPPGETVLSESLGLVKRYAENGRIYRSSSIWAQFAAQPFETAACEDAANGNEEALKYIKACEAIIDREAKMCYWQFVEDMIEFKFTIPEIEEENEVDRFIQKLDGTWANESGIITFDPSGRFSTTQSNQHKFYTGTWMFRTKDNTMVVTSTNFENSEEEDLKVISVDEHNLVFSIDGRTNSVRR